MKIFALYMRSHYAQYVHMWCYNLCCSRIYRIVGNFWGRKFSRLSLHNGFRELNFKDLLDCHSILWYNKELISEAAVKSSKTAKFIVLEIFPLYGMYVHVLHSHKFTHACMYTQYGYYYNHYSCVVKRRLRKRKNIMGSCPTKKPRTT